MSEHTHPYTPHAHNQPEKISDKAYCHVSEKDGVYVATYSFGDGTPDHRGFLNALNDEQAKREAAAISHVPFEQVTLQTSGDNAL